ncbi:MAG: hypothetical protein K2H93_00440 [Oscillospiraceae bacterium]|nr:hypothetical protein [Oscillospiraceae bacterium]
MKKNKNAKIFCTQEQHRMNFYLQFEEDFIYLFSTNYYSSIIFREYANGKPMSYLFRNSRQYRQQNIRSRALRMLTYVEKEYHLQLFEKKKVKVKIRKSNRKKSCQ